MLSFKYIISHISQGPRISRVGFPDACNLGLLRLYY